MSFHPYADVFASFDLEMPMEVDDEYWVHPDPEQAFKQPPGKPSKATAFNCLMRLNQILAFALRTIVGSPLFAPIYIAETTVVVLYQQIEGDAWLCWTPVGAAHSCGTRLGPEQVD